MVFDWADSYIGILDGCGRLYDKWPTRKFNPTYLKNLVKSYSAGVLI